MLTKLFKKALYLIVAAAHFSAHAGSFEDYFIAIRNDNAGVVTDLLKRGFDPNSRDEKGQTGLGIAMREQSQRAARALLAQPTLDVDALNASGESALMMAALKGNLAGMELLLERGARVNQPGWSALHYAATGPEPRAVKVLLDRGAAVDAASPNGSTPLMMAAQYGAEESVMMLVQRGADSRLRNQRDLRAADFARLAGRDSLARRLDQVPQ